MNRLQLFLIALCLLVSLIFLRLVKKQKLREKYIVIWVLGLSFAFFGTLNTLLLSKISNFIGFALLSNFVLVLLIIFTLVQDLHHSIELTRAEYRLESAAIKMAQMELRIQQLEKNI
jgi:fumarate reductase subunit D